MRKGRELRTSRILLPSVLSRIDRDSVSLAEIDPSLSRVSSTAPAGIASSKQSSARSEPSRHTLHHSVGIRMRSAAVLLGCILLGASAQRLTTTDDDTGATIVVSINAAGDTSTISTVTPTTAATTTTTTPAVAAGQPAAGGVVAGATPSPNAGVTCVRRSAEDSDARRLYVR